MNTSCEALELSQALPVLKTSPIGVILGLYWGYIGDIGKEDANYYVGLYRATL